MKAEYYNKILELTRERNNFLEEVNKKLSGFLCELKEIMKDIPKEDVFTEEQDDEIYDEMERMQDLLEEFYENL